MIRDTFYDERGFSTAGVVVALLVTLSLIFSSAQIYQVNSAAADIQNVADLAALAAENEVAEFYIVAQVCDAVILSLSLTGIVAFGLGVAALCTPFTAALSETLLKAGGDILDARNRFAEKAASGLNKIQKLLPFISAANAASIIAANSGGSMGSSYIGLAVLLPFEGEEIVIGPLKAAEELGEEIRDSKKELEQEAKEAEESAKRAKEEKLRAFLHDCGNDPGYCMYERAEKLAVMPAQENPLYRSVETWNFSVALKRAQAYYPCRLAVESPTDMSLEGQADSALRKRFYSYASKVLAQGFVIEDGDHFEAYFPKLPKNTSEMKATTLYTEVVYPVTEDSAGNRSMHAWAGCPQVSASVQVGLGSISTMDQGSFSTCADCQFTVSSFGKIAAASSSIENGFEYHYRIVADAADAYQKAREEYSPHAKKVKALVDDIFGTAKEAFRQAIGYRIAVKPPGAIGAVALVANTSSVSAAKNFSSTFVVSKGTLGAQAAISAATLVGDSSEEGATVLSSLLDGIVNDSSNIGLNLVGGLLELWSSTLQIYARGQAAIEEGFEKALSCIPLMSESGLGTWAADAFSDLVKTLGLEPATLDTLKPVLINTAHVLEADESAFSSQLLGVKKSYIALAGSGSEGLFSTAVTQIEATALESLGDFDDQIVIASIELWGEGGPSIPITIALPPAVKAAAANVIGSAAEALRGITSSWSGIRRWE